ncbi:MAG TPA: CsbD family protein [Nocardioidaceae bacterium]|nr:CsbD family protein [Nocardioidaceae bacterium]
MNNKDKVQHKAEEVAGKAKEKIGEKTDDRKLEGQGRRDQRKADLKQAGDKAKDAVGKHRK